MSVYHVLLPSTSLFLHLDVFTANYINTLIPLPRRLQSLSRTYFLIEATHAFFFLQRSRKRPESRNPMSQLHHIISANNHKNFSTSPKLVSETEKKIKSKGKRMPYGIKCFSRTRREDKEKSKKKGDTFFRHGPAKCRIRSANWEL